MGMLIEDFAQGRNHTPLPAGVSTLSWQTKLTDILPGDWELSDHWASKKANLIDILTHLSGMSRYIRFLWQSAEIQRAQNILSHDLSYKRTDGTLNITRNLRNLRPSYELRENFLYNNQVYPCIYLPVGCPNAIEQMYMVGAHVIATLSGLPFVEFVKDRILKPLRMTQSTYSVDEAVQSGKASETWTPFGRRIPLWLEGLEIELMAGPGGLISNVKELVRVILVQVIFETDYIEGVLGEIISEQRSRFGHQHNHHPTWNS